jgi:rare lipoprotein A
MTNTTGFDRPCPSRCRLAPVAALVALIGLAGCASVAPAPPPARTPDALPRAAPYYSETGIASWYGESHQGRRTASGERFEKSEMTAAHRSLPFDTVLRVTNLLTGREARVRVNDRGPFGRGRMLDLSEAAAIALGIRQAGVAKVRIEAYAADQATTSTESD